MPLTSLEALEKNRPIVDLLSRIGERHDATSGQVALAWLLAQKPFIVPIPGTRSIANMKENTAATKLKLTTQDLADLNSGFEKIDVWGDRAPQNLKESHDLGTSLGTSSKGTNGRTPLRK